MDVQILKFRVSNIRLKSKSRIISFLDDRMTNRQSTQFFSSQLQLLDRSGLDTRRAASARRTPYIGFMDYMVGVCIIIKSCIVVPGNGWPREYTYHGGVTSYETSISEMGFGLKVARSKPTQRAFQSLGFTL